MSAKISNLSELTPLVGSQEKISDGVLGFIGQFNVGQLMRPLSRFKIKGIQLKIVLSALIMSRFRGLSVYAMCQSGQLQIDENTLYRMMNHFWMNWRSLLYGIAMQFIRITKQHGQSNNEVKCFVIDDTDIVKTGATIEGISKIRSHVSHCYHLGFKMLLLAYWDGKSLLALDFSLHRENRKNKFGLTDKQTKAQFSKKRSADSPGADRVQELDQEKPSIVLQMLKRACRHGISAAYVLMDSWFTNDTLIQGIRKMRQGAMHVVGACKMDRRKFMVNGKELNSATLVKANETRKGKKHYSRKFKSEYMIVDAIYKGTPVRLYYIRYRRSKDWKLLLSTDTSLSFVRVMELYQIRWTIEVMFKECKQYLRLGQGQNTDFDGQVADAALTMITHTILSLQLRFKDYETMGGLFRDTQNRMVEETLYRRIMQAILSIIEQLLEILSIDIDETISLLIEDSDKNQKVINLLIAVNQPSTINIRSEMVA